MKNTIRIRKGFNLIEDLSREFNHVNTKEAVALPSCLGAGKIMGMCFPSDLNLYVGDYHLNDPWQLDTINEPDSGTFVIFASIISNKITIKKEGEWVAIDHHGPNTLLFYSSGSSVEMVFPHNEPVKTIAITFTTETVRAIIDQPDVLKGIDPESPFLYLDETVPEAEGYIRSLVNGASRFETYVTLLNLLKLTLYRTFVMKERYNSSGLLKEDVEKLFAIRRTLMENSHMTIKIATLAVEIGMGESKMVRLFKQVFNRTIYQFAQKAKVIKAKDLLSSKKYSVSEVGYMVGYSNMTHFAKAFRKYYKVNPGEYLKKVLAKSLQQ